jgi:hypothetical protein
MRRELERQRQRMDSQLEDFEDALQEMKSELAETERKQQQRLREEVKKIHHRMDQQIGKERADREQQARIMREEYQTLIAEERSERQQQISAIDNRLSNIENRESYLTQRATAYLEDLSILLREIEKLPHNRFAPGKLGKIVAQIRQAEDNLLHGASQASLLGAQNCYLNLIDLRTEVIYQEQMFEQAYLQACQNVKNLLAEVEAYKDATLYPQTEDEFEFQVDYWSNGRLSEIKKTLTEVEQALENNKDSLTTEQVQSLEKEAETLRDNILEALEVAKLSIINSQACYNVSQVVEDVLARQGYEVVDGVYEGDDNRQSYALKMQNLGGDEVVTIIKPSPSRELEYEMQMNFFDRAQDEAVRQELLQTIGQGLSEAGLKQESAAHTTRGVSEPDESVRDFESFRQRRKSQATN